MDIPLGMNNEFHITLDSITGPKGGRGEAIVTFEIYSSGHTSGEDYPNRPEMTISIATPCAAPPNGLIDHKKVASEAARRLKRDFERILATLSSIEATQSTPDN